MLVAGLEMELSLGHTAQRNPRRRVALSRTLIIAFLTPAHPDSRH
jgi:hypothetical protein